MKKTLPLIALLCASTATLAQEGSAVTGIDVNNGETAYTSVCVAATQSWSALDSAIEEYGFTPRDTQEIYCNSTQLMRFARENLRRNVYVPTKVVLKKTDSTTETEVCLAALKGEPLPRDYATYNAMQTLRCNGKPLSSFVNGFSQSEIVEIL